MRARKFIPALRYILLFCGASGKPRPAYFGRALCTPTEKHFIKQRYIMLLKKLEMLNYLNKRDKRIKFKRAENTYSYDTSGTALKKAKQLLWKIKAKQLPLLQNASYCYSFVWVFGESHENKKYYVVDIYDNTTYARILKNPAEIYSTPQLQDKVSYSKLYNNINRILVNL